MSKRSVSLQVLGGIGALLFLLFSSSSTSGGSPQEKSSPSVKDLQLKVSPNGRYFVDQNGKPFFYLGDTCWLLFQRLNHEELDEYLKDRAGKGFTVIQAYVLRGLGKKHPDGNSSLREATPLIDRDPTRPNEEFFKNVDYVVNRANELGLVMGLVTAKSWHVNQHPEKVFDDKNAYIFGNFLGQRYKNNAVMWFPGGDSAPGKDEAIWVAMAKGLKDGSGGRHLVCYHGSGGTSSSQWFHQTDWLDFNSIQSGHGWAAPTYRRVSHDYRLSPAKPTVDMEPSYENHPTGAKTPRIDSHQVRKGAYWALLAGAAGHGYGALDLFWFYKDSDGPFPRNGFQHWRTALAYEGSGQVGLMRKLFELRPWYKLVPDQSVIASGQGEGEDHIQAARANDGSFVIAYLPHGGKIGIHMDKLTGKTAKAHWYDPRTGKWSDIGEYPNTGAREFVAPSKGDHDDWVLVLDDASKGYPISRAVGKSTDWKPEAAGKYLDERDQAWFGSANCISCHTSLPYALARPALHKLDGDKTPSEQETKLLAQVRNRVANWKRLDSKEFGLYYDTTDELKKQSWGTEAVFNSVILAFDDRYQSRSSPSDATKQAFAHLWETQLQTGANRGSWDWLDFSEAPWGNQEARYFGAALAAIAVGIAPGYYAPGADPSADVKVNLLRDYLRDRFPKQNLHNQAWGLWAATNIEGILTKAEQKKLIDQVLDQQQKDGGWCLPSLGSWARNDGTAQNTASDGYATALLLHILQSAGLPKDDPRIAKGLAWLKRNQSATGAWPSVSLVKRRDPASHTGKFMSDAATAYAVLALGH